MRSVQNRLVDHLARGRGALAGILVLLLGVLAIIHAASMKSVNCPFNFSDQLRSAACDPW
jgi:hypothetical protein